ncbi:MAG TPA: hypothetical protein VHA12_00125 [Candidatus Nanoarchaeia archaeon]|nr:hypothetical protein [Candidatus Nanoarchaeia archaeon]
MVQREKGVRSKTYINGLDLVILKTIDNKKDVGVMWLKDHLEMGALNTRIHLSRLIELELITRSKVPKTNRAVLKTTLRGKEVLKLFENY